MGALGGTVDEWRKRRHNAGGIAAVAQGFGPVGTRAHVSHPFVVDGSTLQSRAHTPLSLMRPRLARAAILGGCPSF